MKFREMRVLLTGATGGIGRALAVRLAHRGAALLLTGRDAARLDAYASALHERHGVEVTACAADLDDPADLARLVDAAKAFGVNTLVNNAGVNAFAPFERHSDAEIRSLVDTNVVAPMLLTRALLPMLSRRDAACIVNVGSVIGSIGMPGQAVYCATKFAMHGFTEALRRELRGGPVRVLYVAPRSTDTTMNSAAMRDVNARMGVRSDTPETVAVAAVAAMAGTRRERFIGFPERLFVKLNALFPGLVDRSLQRQADLLHRGDAADDAPVLTEGVER